MSFVLVVTPRAAEDAEEAALWYDKQRKGLGEDFLLAVEAELNSIARNPNQYAIMRGQYRRAVVQRFPFGIFYAIENERIIVFSVWHYKRKPFGWLRKK